MTAIPDGTYYMEYLIDANGGGGPSLEISTRLKYELGAASTMGEVASAQTIAEIEALDAAMIAYKESLESSYPVGNVNIGKIFYTRTQDEDFPPDPMS